MGSFTNSNLTEGRTNRDFGEVVAQGGSTVIVSQGVNKNEIRKKKSHNDVILLPFFKTFSTCTMFTTI